MSSKNYAEKRRSGNMMYGPCRSTAKYPDWRPNHPKPGRYWWGEPKPDRQSERDAMRAKAYEAYPSH